MVRLLGVALAVLEPEGSAPADGELNWLGSLAGGEGSLHAATPSKAPASASAPKRRTPRFSDMLIHFSLQ